MLVEARISNVKSPPRLMYVGYGEEVTASQVEVPVVPCDRYCWILSPCATRTRIEGGGWDVYCRRVEGIYTEADGIYKEADGIYTRVEGIYTMAEGIYTMVEGIYPGFVG